MPNKESQNSLPVNFLGRVMQERPEAIDSLSPREGYILFSHVDPANPSSSYEALGQTLGVSATRVGEIFRKILPTVYARAPHSIQEDFDLTAIFEATAGRNGKKIKQETKEKLNLVKGSINWDPVTHEEDLLLEVVDPEDHSLWSYAQENNLTSLIIENGYMKPEELDALAKCFEEGLMTSQTEALLNKFSILVANLAY